MNFQHQFPNLFLESDHVTYYLLNETQVPKRSLEINFKTNPKDPVVTILESQPFELSPYLLHIQEFWLPQVKS